jgi:hypothetical protein
VSQDPNTALGVPTPPSDAYGAPKVAAAQQVESDQESYTPSTTTQGSRSRTRNSLVTQLTQGEGERHEQGPG